MYEKLNMSLQQKELISIVGGGGKTTTMFKLANELVKNNKKVLIGTTTAIMKPSDGTYDKLIISQNENDFTNIPDRSITVIAGEYCKDKNKLFGANKDFVDVLYKLDIFDYIIIEADGAKRKPIKAAADHEPIIPSLTTKTIGIIGMDSLNTKLYEENVHRAEIFAQVTNSKIGDIINEDIIYRLIISKSGLFKGSSNKSEKYVILNKVEISERKSIAENIRERVLSSNTDINDIIVGSMRSD